VTDRRTPWRVACMWHALKGLGAAELATQVLIVVPCRVSCESDQFRMRRSGSVLRPMRMLRSCAGPPVCERHDDSWRTTPRDSLSRSFRHHRSTRGGVGQTPRVKVEHWQWPMRLPSYTMPFRNSFGEFSLMRSCCRPLAPIGAYVVSYSCRNSCAGGANEL
jgi:hypothetical protein